MKVELHWQQIHAAQAHTPSDQLASGRLRNVPLDVEARRRPFGRMLALEQSDEDRRLSIAGAFSIFIFGCGCGAVWTLLLTWLF